MAIGTRRAAALLLCCGLATVAGAPAGHAPAPAGRRAVVSLAAGAEVPTVAGLRVLARHPHVGAATVSGTPEALAALRRRPGVRAVVPDSALRPTNHGGDPQGASVYSWERLGGVAGRAAAGAGVTVALVDTGVSDTPALHRASGRLVDAVDTSGEGRFTDGYGHGTFMAGLIAGGELAPAGPVVGVAPGARILNVKVADATGTTSLSRVVAGLDWVAAHAASVNVTSFSFSRERPGTGYGPDPLTDAVDRVGAAGVTVVVSAGNRPDQVGDPGFDPRALTVGAADVRHGRAEVAPFSGSAVVAGVPKPDVVGSGLGVLSVLPAGSVIARSYPEARRGALWRGSGTSQATAQVAGVAAIFLAGFPDASPAEVKASLRAAARPLAGGVAAGAGLIGLAHRRVAGGDGPGAGDGGGTGEGGFDANSWSANSWSANSWSANSWSANSWSANSWSANSWSWFEE